MTGRELRNLIAKGYASIKPGFPPIPDSLTEFKRNKWTRDMKAALAFLRRGKTIWQVQKMIRANNHQYTSFVISEGIKRLEELGHIVYTREKAS